MARGIVEGMTGVVWCVGVCYTDCSVVGGGWYGVM